MVPTDSITFANVGTLFSTNVEPWPPYFLSFTLHYLEEPENAFQNAGTSKFVEALFDGIMLTL